MDNPISSKSDPYILARDFKSASRLNYEHYLWHSTLGYHLHPTIKSSLPSPSSSHHYTPSLSVKPSNLKIADIACGTALWLTHVAELFPSASLTGLDINLSQCPPHAWLPPNVGLKKWDIFSDEPLDEDLSGAFDIVHVRLVFVVVESVGGDSRDVVRRLMRLVRPGGWLQWDELDVAGSCIMRADAGDEEGGGVGGGDDERRKRREGKTPVMEKRVDELREKGKWVGGLAEAMAECGMVECRLWRFQEKKELARAFFDNHLAKDEEMAGERSMGTLEGRQMRQKVWEMYEESRGGVVIATPKLVCTARRLELDEVMEGS